MNRLARRIQTKTALNSLAIVPCRSRQGTYHNNTNTNTKRINHHQKHLPGRSKPQPLIHIQPEHTRETETEPAGEECRLLRSQSATARYGQLLEGLVGRAYHETEKIAKHRNRLCDNPRDYPESHGDPDPRSNGHEIPLVHSVCACEDARVDQFAGNVTTYDAGNNNLMSVSHW